MGWGNKNKKKAEEEKKAAEEAALLAAQQEEEAKLKAEQEAELAKKAQEEEQKEKEPVVKKAPAPKKKPQQAKSKISDEVELQNARDGEIRELNGRVIELEAELREALGKAGASKAQEQQQKVNESLTSRLPHSKEKNRRRRKTSKPTTSKSRSSWRTQSDKCMGRRNRQTIL